jgi:hypothetical protein
VPSRIQGAKRVCGRDKAFKNKLLAMSGKGGFNKPRNDYGYVEALSFPHFFVSQIPKRLGF